MKVAGVVCEYNPFHNGHAYHLNAAREAGATHIVAVMSGNFVQRGTGAFCDKWARARAAVRCGADLILENPLPFSCAGAGVFARGAVTLLQALGCVDLLTFGAETEELALLQAAANAGASAAVQAQMQRLHAAGSTYPAAMQQAVEAIYGEETAAVLSQPNNTLAVEYLKAAKEANCSFSFLPVKRVGASHDAETPREGFASANMLRKMQTPQAMRPFLPQAAWKEIFSEQTLFFDETSFETAALCALRTQSSGQMERYVADGSGLVSRLFAASRAARSLEELYAQAKTKSITAAKVRRAVLHCFLEIDQAWQKQRPPYLRVLAANKRGLELLHCAAPKLPLLTKHKEAASFSPQAQAFYAMQCCATDLYAAVCAPKGAPSLEQTHAMMILS